MYWEAFQDLQSERRTARGSIPISAIIAYADRYGLDPDTLKRIVWKVDRVLIKFWTSKDEAEKRQREAEAKQKRELGGRS